MLIYARTYVTSSLSYVRRTISLERGRCPLSCSVDPDIVKLANSVPNKQYDTLIPQHTILTDMDMEYYSGFPLNVLYTPIHHILLQGTAYGYIRYSMKESADAAKMLLDGATIAGSTIRLSYADNTGENKRAKLD